jgi:hypothetical protein
MSQGASRNLGNHPYLILVNTCWHVTTPLMLTLVYAQKEPNLSNTTGQYR